MTFPHSDSERMHAHTESTRAIESHGQPDHVLDPETREMRERSHTGIELTAAELAYLKESVSNDLRKAKDRISQIEDSLYASTSANTANDEEELSRLRKVVAFLEGNLLEKLFEETGAGGAA